MYILVISIQSRCQNIASSIQLMVQRVSLTGLGPSVLHNGEGIPAIGVDLLIVSDTCVEEVIVMVKLVRTTLDLETRNNMESVFTTSIQGWTFYSF